MPDILPPADAGVGVNEPKKRETFEMRTLMTIAALAAMGTVLMAGTALAQTPYDDGSQAAVRDAATGQPCPGSWLEVDLCQPNLSGTLSVSLKVPSTGEVFPYNTCQVDAHADVTDSGLVLIDTWETSGNEDCVRYEPCNGDWMTGVIVKPGTPWSVGNGFSVYIDGNACFTNGFGNWDMGTASFMLSGDALMSDALSWTMGQTVGQHPTSGFEMVFAAELESDTELIVTETQ